jgi:isobutyryl-CoA mutase
MASESAPAPRRHPIRIVTAASLFDGHDASINIMRRLLQAQGAEVVHLGHDRAVATIVNCAVQEDAQAVAITSYQGGHVEYFKYMHDLLAERGASTRIFGGGGGTILPTEVDELHAHGITRLYSPDDGRALGLEGMIADLLQRADHATVEHLSDVDLAKLPARDPRTIARLITLAETKPELRDELHAALAHHAPAKAPPVLGITGTGGAGKSSLIDELVRRFLRDFPDKTIAIISVDPSKRKSGGALLGDRIRMNAIDDPRVFMRSMATRQANLALSKHVGDALAVVKAANFDLVILETSGIGQSDTEITEFGDASLYVMTAEYGAPTQLEKIDMLDFADVVAINKFDKPGSLDAIRDVRKQWRRNHNRFDGGDETLPIYGTIASQFADEGMNALYAAVMRALARKTGAPLDPKTTSDVMASASRALLPEGRVRYLGDIADTIARDDEEVVREAQAAREAQHLREAAKLLGAHAATGDLQACAEGKARTLSRLSSDLLAGWPALQEQYAGDVYRYQVRDKIIEQPLTTSTLSGTKLPRVCLPKFHDEGDVLTWLRRENVPGAYPFTAGVFPLKREGEDPTRMFAGEGGPERTNRRFHYVSRGMPAKRLSTAFDSVTLYGQDPDKRPDVYGKIGNSGVSVASLDDAKRLYSGFDLCHPATSVSMTINGPAPIVLAFFMNAAIDQQCERYLASEGKLEDAKRTLAAKWAKRGLPCPSYEGELPQGNDGLGLALLGGTGDEVLPPEVYAKIRQETLAKVRGTVQADILKEDQAQNTCIFSTEFALRMMGDIQASFIANGVRNFYSVSISGYHIAEAGANPVSQLAFTLANGFTFVEYYLARGLAIDDFAPNLSFFFSNGLDPEYTVIGRVARRIWARAMKLRYGAKARSQMLKYHIQTSGRSLHAQEIAFNDVRTTLQALLAIYDNCNSLHTNAYDEAITTPTEESVRRAMAIQLIINKELGLAKNENPLQGSFVVEELTDLVEQAVLGEFRRISERGGVLGAMERMYQRTKIQEESLHYERQKHDGTLPIIGVNTFLDPQGSPTIIPAEVIRSTVEERDRAVARRDTQQAAYGAEVSERLARLEAGALRGANVFDELLETAKFATLGQISRSLYAVGGQYRRNM